MLTVNEEGITAEMLSSMIGVSRSTKALFRVFDIWEESPRRANIWKCWETGETLFSCFFIIKQ